LTKLPGAARAGTKRQCSLFDGGLGLKRERPRVLASGGLSNPVFYRAHFFRAAAQQNGPYSHRYKLDVSSPHVTGEIGTLVRVFNGLKGPRP